MPRKGTKSTKNILRLFVPFVFLCAFLCISATAARAASLFGKVIEVHSGDVITIFNLNRPVRVRLMGIDAPEMNQAFGDVARGHLSDLVFEKSVLVEYAGIAADRSLNGRVLLNGADIGAQMIRDGVAWFDPRNGNLLSANDRAIYQQSEEAARSEKRGLWQQENAIAPWEFVRDEARKSNRVTSPDPTLTSLKRPASRPALELTNLTLMKTEATGSPRRELTRSELDNVYASLSATDKNLHELRPAGQNFSVLVPEDGRQITQPVPIAGLSIDVNLYVVREGSRVYYVLWFTAPSIGETDQMALNETVVDVIKSAHKDYQRGDRGYFVCGKQSEKNISMNGYTGVEYDMSSCSLPTRARAFTRANGDQREMYIGIVFYGENDAHVGRFIRSFVAGPTTKAKPGTSRN